MPISTRNPFRITDPFGTGAAQTLLGQSAVGGLANPASGFGYQGFGPSEYSFFYGPYGFGSFGWEPGNTNAGFAAPSLEKMFDTIGRSAKTFALT